MSKKRLYETAIIFTAIGEMAAEATEATVFFTSTLPPCYLISETSTMQLKWNGCSAACPHFYSFGHNTCHY